MSRNADTLSSVFAILDAGSKSIVFAHAVPGMGPDNDGLHTEHCGFDVVRIDNTLRGKEYLETILHEWAHGRFPEWTEEAVALLGKQLADIVYTSPIMLRAGLGIKG